MKSSSQLSLFLTVVLVLNSLSSVLGSQPKIRNNIPPKTLQSQPARRTLQSLAQERTATDYSTTGQRLNTILKETSAMFEQLKSHLIGGITVDEDLSLFEGQREQLELLDQEFTAIFQDVGQKLQSAGLTEKLEALSEFENHYRREMNFLRQQISVLLQDHNRQSPNELLTHIQQIQAELKITETGDSKPRTFGIRNADPSDVGHPTRMEAYRSFTALADDEPIAEDLAETPVVQLTPEIRAKTAELKNSPVQIYEFVRNSVNFEPYFGMMQNSQSVFWSARANDFDQSTLLIALMRAAGVPARYVSGKIRLPIDQVINWVGAKNSPAAIEILKQSTYVETVTNSDVLFEHRWVEVFVPTPSGNQWVGLSPSLKFKRYQAGILLPKLAFDRMAYLSSIKPQLSTEAYTDQLREYLHNKYPGKSSSDVAYTGPILADQSGSLPSELPFSVEKIYGKGPAFTSIIHHRITVNVVNLNTNTPFTKVDLSVPEVSLSSITVSFGGASKTDQKTMALFGGFTQTPAFLLAGGVPQIRLDDTIVASGTTAPPTGQFVGLFVDYYFPGSNQRLLQAQHFLRVGESGCVVLNAYQNSQPFLNRRIDRLATGTPELDNSPERTVREMLHIAGIRYFQRYNTEHARLEELQQLKYILWRPAGGATIAASDFESLFDRPFLITPATSVVDLKWALTYFADLNSPDTETPELTNFRQMEGLTGSALEHELWEEMTLVPSISTTKGLQLASESHIPIVTITKDNAASQFAQFQDIPDSTKQFMQSNLDQGYIVITPIRPVTYNNWLGLTFITENQVSGGFGYWISRYNGGSSTLPPHQTTDPRTGQTGGNPSRSGGCASGQPVSISNGNMFHTFTDMFLAGRGIPIEISRTYNSQSTYSGPFGYGWTHSYNRYIKEDGGKTIYVDESGGEFSFGSSGNYLSPPGLNMTLTKEAQGYKLREANGTQLLFDGNGKLASLSDRNGNTQKLSYDGHGNLLKITDALNRDVTLAYNSRNQIVEIQDFTGRKAGYGYDDQGNLVESTDFAGSKTTYSYYSGSYNNHNLKVITFPEGNTITYVYYASDRLYKHITGEGGEQRYIYLPLRNETIVVNERGFATSLLYNAKGQVTRMIDPAGNQVEQTWNENANVISRTDEAGFKNTYEYDSKGNLLKGTDPLGNSIDLAYEPNFNQITSFRDKKGNLTKFSYDSKGNLTQITDALGAMTGFTYDAFGNPLSVTDAEGNTFSIAYDERNNPTELRDANGNRTQFRYDALNRLTTRINALNQEAHIEYDSVDRISALTDELGNQTSFGYDRNGNLTQLTDANGNSTRYTYDKLNNLVQVTNALGQVTRYGYSDTNCSCTPNQNLASITNAKGNTWTYAYDFRDRLIQSQDPSGNVTQYAYDARGNLVAKTDANGNTVRYEYDALNRLIRKVFPDSTENTFGYDADNNLLKAVNPNVTLTYAYDALNRVVSATDSRFPNSIQYTHDRIGRRKSMTDLEGGTTAYSYDKAGLVKSIVNPKGQSTAFAYDVLNRRTQMVYANNTQVSYQYDAASRLTALVHSAQGRVFAQNLYAYDKVGNRTAMTDETATHLYQYDRLYRLVSATTQPLFPSAAPTPIPGIANEKYVYDPVGNRTQSATQQNWSYDAADRLLKVDDVSFSYDKNGNTVGKTDSQGVTKNTYDFENRLTGIDHDGKRVAAYKYDPFGRRIEKSVGSEVTRFVYDQEDILGEYDSSNRLAARYTHGPGIDEPLVMERDGKSWFYHADGLGSITRLTGDDGKTEQTYRYDAFGKPISPKRVVTNSYTYVGRECDQETETYYIRARYYDPVIGRFQISDPTGLQGGINRYTYVYNNPITLVDLSGKDAIALSATSLLFGEAATGIALTAGGVVIVGGLIVVGVVLYQQSVEKPGIVQPVPPVYPPGEKPKNPYPPQNPKKDPKPPDPEPPDPEPPSSEPPPRDPGQPYPPGYRPYIPGVPGFSKPTATIQSCPIGR